MEIARKKLLISAEEQAGSAFAAYSYCSPNELAGCLKRLTTKEGNNNFGNDVRLVNSRYLHNLSLQQLGDQVIGLQKYVKSHGAHAFICRTVFRSETSSHCFLITNRVAFDEEEVPEPRRLLVTNPEQNNSKKPTIVKATQGRHLRETLGYLKEVVTFLRMHRGIDLQELVGDFIKD
ncbi:unnamed protein product [Sphagnum balticum]